tara:strand:+ start:224 stop:439 length:216 start_codon:yes stop_codon:yes gene_type:complete
VVYVIQLMVTHFDKYCKPIMTSCLDSGCNATTWTHMRVCSFHCLLDIAWKDVYTVDDDDVLNKAQAPTILK